MASPPYSTPPPPLRRLCWRMKQIGEIGVLETKSSDDTSSNLKRLSSVNHPFFTKSVIRQQSLRTMQDRFPKNLPVRGSPPPQTSAGAFCPPRTPSVKSR